MKITLMDDEFKKKIRVYDSGDSYIPGHTNRIFKIKIVENKPNLFVSGGWDSTLFLWDIRTPKSVNSLFGPCISGDAIDVKENLILTGSYRDKDCLELFDLRNFTKICTI